MTNRYAGPWYLSLDEDDAEEIKLDFAVALERAMAHASLSKAELARSIKVSPARISKVLRGDSNLTIETMSSLARATGHRVHIHLARSNAKIRWLEVHNGTGNTMQVANAPKDCTAASTIGTTDFDEDLIAL